MIAWLTNPYPAATCDHAGGEERLDMLELKPKACSKGSEAILGQQQPSLTDLCRHMNSIDVYIGFYVDCFFIVLA